VKVVGSNCIDYWQSPCLPGNIFRHRFGLRVQEGRCVALTKLSEGPARTYGDTYPLPLNLEILPITLRMMMEDHVRNCPTSDLIEVLVGQKSFQEALKSPIRIEPKAKP